MLTMREIERDERRLGYLASAAGGHSPELLRRELDHRVFNNLQIMMSLLDLQIAGTVSEEARSALLVAATRLRSIAIVNELHMASGGLGMVDALDLAKGFTAAMTETFSSSTRKLAMTVEGPELALDIDKATDLCIISAEFLSDALGFEDSACRERLVLASLSWTIDEGRSLFSIAVELPESLALSIPSYEGRRLIQALSDCIGARFSVATGPLGCELRLSF